MKATDIRLTHRGEYLCYYEIDYLTKNNNKKTYEMVSKFGATKLDYPDLTLENIGKEVIGVVLFVFNEDKTRVLLTNEFRMGVNRYVIGNVAGLVDYNECYFETCKRELKEETNLDLLSVEEVFLPSYTCAPVTDDVTTLVICKASGVLSESDSEYEEVGARWYGKEEVKRLLRNRNVMFAGRCQALCYAWVNGGL